MKTYIKDTGPSIDINAVHSIEKQLSKALPRDYVSFLLRYNGGRPLPDVITVDGIDGNCTDVQVIFGIDHAVKTDNLIWNIETLPDIVAAGFLPIGVDSGGLPFVLSLRDRDYGTVFFIDSLFSWCKDPPTMYQVADSFNQFLDELREL